MPPTLQSRHQFDFAKEDFAHAKRSCEHIRVEGIDDKARTVSLSFASEAVVSRWYGNEILEISDDACDLTRLRNGGALLYNHNWNDQIGVVVSAEIDSRAKKARAVVKFSSSVRGEEFFRDVKEGIRRLVSVGYSIRKMVLQSVDGDMETHRATEWEPFEISIVPVPADVTVGVGRNAQGHASPPSKMPPVETPAPETRTAPTPPNPAPTTAPAVTITHDRQAELGRVKSINAHARSLSEKFPDKADQIRQMADRCNENGETLDVFRAAVVEDVLGTSRQLSPAPVQDHRAATLDLKKRDIEGYSLMAAIREAAVGAPVSGRAKEFSDEIAGRLGIQPRGFFIPEDIVRSRRGLLTGARTMTVTSPADGGFTVGQDVLASEFVQLIRNTAKVVRMGARTITGLKGDISIPRQITGATAYWVSETGSITDSGATFGQIVGKPKRVGTNVPYSKQLLAQSSLDIEAMVIMDSDEAIGVDVDRVALNGAGGAEPLGILNQTAGASGNLSADVAFGGAPTWAKYLEFFSNVATNNAALGRLGYMTSVASAVKAMTIPKFTNGVEGIWVGGLDPNGPGRVGPFPAEWSTNIPTGSGGDKVIFGDWSQIIILEWAGRDVVVDPYSAKKTGNVEVCIQRLLDVVIRRAKSLCKSSDAGNQ